LLRQIEEEKAEEAKAVPAEGFDDTVTTMPIFVLDSLLPRQVRHHYFLDLQEGPNGGNLDALKLR
jgi:hypothetical protein